MKGLICNVYRAKGHDGTNEGVTKFHDRVLLVGKGVVGVFEEDEDRPTLELVRRIIGGHEYIHAVPKEQTNKNSMFGGNFVYTSDGRFPNKYPIPVHDRFEVNDHRTD